MATLSCEECGKQLQILKRCTRCQSVFYCSRECQAKHWPAHREQCHVRQSLEIAARAARAPVTGGHGPAADKRIFAEDGPVSASADTPRPTPTIGVNFQDAFNTLSVGEQGTPGGVGLTSAVEGPDGGSACGPPTRSYINNDQVFHDVPERDPAAAGVVVVVKAHREKLRVGLQASWSGEQMVKCISHRTEIPLNALKLIHKGRLVTAVDIRDVAADKALFQAVGERAESGKGVHADDVAVLMNQCGVGRNEAIQALKRTDDLVDAILHLGNK